ncbi:MAG: tRNA (uridine(54)-C5)-methyltransferase TrmA [Luminiphilus sp.]|nr:tRNA (uridine(54)-C5)-methyltransferase TrmA [Luminiphilus sp.]MDG1460485.1 tRNA (uridine(54)-C5)-methyltransferase TrmA [Luminiphilus sp.]
MPLSNIDPNAYEHLLALKIAPLVEVFEALGAPEPQIIKSPPLAFRLRAEFRIWHDGEDLFYAMFKPSAPKDPVAITNFPIASKPIQQLMPELLQELRHNTHLRRKLFQVEFLSTLTGDMLVTLIYHRALDTFWEDEANLLAERLNIKLIGRSRKQKKVLGAESVQEVLRVNNRPFYFKQPDQAFTQPNGCVNQCMIEWADSACENLSGDLLELYCGIGNFSLPLAHHFGRVLATEVSKVATAAAIENCNRNDIKNVEFARLSAEEMTAAMSGERPFRRLAHLPVPLTDYRLNTLLVDPPRAGLDDATLSLAGSFKNIIYISCSPKTLIDNLRILKTTHQITQLAFFDQFPYTNHLESGVLLTRRAL